MEMSQHHFNINSFNCCYNNALFNTPFDILHNVNDFGAPHERAEILAWLSPLEPQIRHGDIGAHRVENVGDWLLQTEEYRNWFAGIRSGKPDNSALFCYGDPGVGKTYIT